MVDLLTLPYRPSALSFNTLPFLVLAGAANDSDGDFDITKVANKDLVYGKSFFKNPPVYAELISLETKRRRSGDKTDL